MEKHNIGNIMYYKEGNSVVLEFAIAEGNPSSTGVMNLIATSSGWKTLEGLFFQKTPITASFNIGYKVSKELAKTGNTTKTAPLQNMGGFTISVDNSTLIIKIPMGEGSPSSSGKMNLFLSTKGFQKLGIFYKGQEIAMQAFVGYKVAYKDRAKNED